VKTWAASLCNSDLVNPGCSLQRVRPGGRRRSSRWSRLRFSGFNGSSSRRAIHGIDCHKAVELQRVRPGDQGRRALPC